MVIVYLLASFAGAFATVAAMWSDGWPLALLCAPLGGSALAVVVASGAALLTREKDIPSRPGAVPSHV